MDGPQREHSSVNEFMMLNSLNMTTRPVDSLTLWIKNELSFMLKESNVFENKLKSVRVIYLQWENLLLVGSGFIELFWFLFGSRIRKVRLPLVVTIDK
jgi:hypothetical protein